MDPECNEGKTSPLILKNTDKYEEDRAMCVEKQELNGREKTAQLKSTLGQCPAKRRLTDNEEEMTTPNTKRIKQERDDSGLYKENLHTIAREVADSLELESDTCEISHSTNKKQNFEKANNTRIGQHDVTVVLDNAVGQPNHLLLIAKNRKETVEPTAERRKQTIPMPSTAEQVHHEAKRPVPSTVNQVHYEAKRPVPSAVDQNHYEPKRPILRTLKGLDSRGSNGFAFDHNFFPKLVEVHSVSSSSKAKTSFSTKQKTHRDLPQTREFSPPFEKQDENIAANGPVNVLKISATSTGASSHSKLLNTCLHAPVGKHYDLLFTFRQSDGQNDMFLVIDDEVFSVKRYEYKGESYLIHTNRCGKTMILAKLPEKVKAGSHMNAAVSSQSGLNEQRETTKNGYTSALQQPGNTSLQQFALKHPTTAPVSITPLQVRRHMSANSVQQRNFQRIPSVTRAQVCSKLPNMYELPPTRVTRNDTLNLGKGQQSQAAEQSRRNVNANTARSVTPDHQHVHPVSGAILQPSHPVNANESFQTSTAAQNNMFSALRDPHSSSSRVRDHQLVFKQNEVGMVESTNEINFPSEEPIAMTTEQGRYSGSMENNSSSQGYLVTNGGSDDRRYDYVTLSPEEKQRIICGTRLISYIAQRVTLDIEESSTNASVVRRSEFGDAGRTPSRTTANESFTRRVRASAHGQVTPNRQIYHTNTCLTAEGTERRHTGRRNEPSLVRTMEIHDGSQIPVNQLARQSSGLIKTQPDPDAQGHITNPVYDRLRMNDGAHSNNGTLQTVDSWQGRLQQRISLENDPSQVNKVLIGRTAGVTGIPAPNTATALTSSIRRVSQSAPVISQVSFGVINRSVAGENVPPKQSATALVIDPDHSIYIDATDSVVDEELLQEIRSRIIGQRLSNEGMAVRQSRNYNTTNQHQSSYLSNIKFRSSASSQSSISRMPNQSTLSAPKIDKRCVAHNALKDTLSSTPKIDKRCVDRNTLKNMVQTITPPSKGHGVPIQKSGHRSSSDSSKANNADTDDIVEMMMKSTSKQSSQLTKMVPSDTHGRQRQTGKNPSQSAADDSRPGAHDDDDIVEIVYKRIVPEENAPNGSRNSRVVSKDRPKSCPQFCSETSDSVEIVNPSSKQGSQLPKVVLLEEDDEEKDALQQDGYIGDSALKKLLQPLPNGSSTTAPPQCNGRDRADTQEHKERSGNELAEETNPNSKRNSDPSQTDGYKITDEEKDRLEQYIYNQTELKNIHERDRLLKKIKNTQKRMAKETIDWKKKYLHRLEVQLMKKLAKLSSVTKYPRGNNGDDS